MDFEQDTTITPPNPTTSVPILTPPQNGPMPPKDTLARVIGFILAFIIPPLGVIISLIVLGNRKKKLQKTSRLSRSGVLIGSILSVPFILWVGFYALLGGFYRNGPQSAFKPIGTKLVQLGGHMICDNGDNGHGLDNTTPWYRAYYSMPATDNLKSEVYAAAAAANFKLTVNTNEITALKDLTAARQTTPPNTDDYYNPNSDYLMGANGPRILTVTINRQTSVRLDCAQGAYGRYQETGADTAIVTMYLE